MSHNPKGSSIYPNRYKFDQTNQTWVADNSDPAEDLKITQYASHRYTFNSDTEGDWDEEARLFERAFERVGRKVTVKPIYNSRCTYYFRVYLQNDSQPEYPMFFIDTSAQYLTDDLFMYEKTHGTK